MLKIGPVIAAKLKDKNMTQKMLADMIGADYRAVSTYVNNKCYPDLDTLSHICNSLDININFLLDIHTSDKSDYIIDNIYEYELCKYLRCINEEKLPKTIQAFKLLCELIAE